VAWFRPMGADEVAYHRSTVLERSDEHPGAALAYYGSRGETPLHWAGAGAGRLGLAGEVISAGYDAAFGAGGFRHPDTGERLVVARRPGFELVVSAHKSVAVLGVMDRADEMHSILDVETKATMDWLDGWFAERGGRRGRVRERTATGGLVYAVTRHATSRAGDPSPHDHVLVANVIEMLDTRGGFKGLDSAALRDTVEAATMVGRLHSAARAIELGLRIEADDGPSGNLRHWRVAGIPAAVCEVFSKRSDEILEHLEKTGLHGYRARGLAARATRSVKRHTGVAELLPRWRAELQAVGWPIERLATHLEQTGGLPRGRTGAPAGTGGRTGGPAGGRGSIPLTDAELDALAADVLDVDGRLLANRKVFTRTNLVAEVAPRLYGRDPAELDRVLARIVGSDRVIPLIGVAGAREQSYTTVEVLTAEATIAETVERLAVRSGPAVAEDQIAATVAAAEQARGHGLTAGQRRVVEQLCTGGSGVSMVVGVAGSGKTTALDTATRVLEQAGHRVLGTSTSGQAARTLANEAAVEARTFQSMLWRLDRGQITLDGRTVVVVDEAGMADDAKLARLVLAVERAGASLVLVGDHRQLDAVGPGGALVALLERHPDLVVTLDENVRQHDPAERRALAMLRNGDPADAIARYANQDRIRVEGTRVETLVAMTDAWAADVDAGHDTALLAWRRQDVTDLNRLARDRWARLGRLDGDDVEAHPGRWYAPGDRLIALAPNPQAEIVTSEPLRVLAVTEGSMTVHTSHGRTATLTGEALDAEHLDYGYALTVHRAQGATYDRAHVLAAGGGRELAYVACSRARDCTTIHTTADDLPQAVDDLHTDWGAEHQQLWITDTLARQGHEPEPARSPERASSPEPPARPLPERQRDARGRLHDLENEYDTLLAGTGRWRDTDAGAAARQLNVARDQLADARHTAHDTNVSRRERRSVAKALPQLEAAVKAAERTWNQVGAPEEVRLQEAIDTTNQDLANLGYEVMTERMNHVQARDHGRSTGRGIARGL
jgi:conjugative relaxase-like TrwC/TraI family protein